MNKVYSIISPEGNLWQAIDDMNSDESWGEGIMIWKSEDEARKCLEYHQKTYDDKYKDYQVAMLKVSSVFTLEYE